MDKKSEITVLLADDHGIVRKGIRSLLEQESWIKIVGEAEDGMEVLKKAGKLLPDILVLDISLPLLNGLEVARRLNKLHSEIKIIILSMHDSDDLIYETLQAGVKGYILKKSAPDQLVSAIRAVSLGKSFFSPEISKIIDERKIEQGQLIGKESILVPALTGRESDILQLVAEGHSNREIAEILFISIKTVENHRSKIMEKMNFRNIADLIKYAVSKGIIQLRD